MAALRRVAGLQRLLGLPVRAVSSGRTANSTVSARIPPASRPLEVVEWHPMEKEKEKSPFVKNPDFHGFHEDPVIDVQYMHVSFFFGISICLVLGSTFLYYLPDQRCFIGLAGKLNEKLRSEQNKGCPSLPLITTTLARLCCPLRKRNDHFNVCLCAENKPPRYLFLLPAFSYLSLSLSAGLE